MGMALGGQWLLGVAVGTKGLILGLLVASGESEGEKLGLSAAEGKVEASWLMGDLGNMPLAMAGAVSDLGATEVSSGGGGALCTVLALPLPAELPLWTLAASSLSLAISLKTWASGWYCGPQSSR